MSEAPETEPCPPPFDVADELERASTIPAPPPPDCDPYDGWDEYWAPPTTRLDVEREHEVL